MALTDLHEDPYVTGDCRFRMSDNGRPIVIVVTQEAVEDNGGFDANRARFAAAASEKHDRKMIEPNGTIMVRSADL